MSIQILLCSSPVPLDAKLQLDTAGHRRLELFYRGTPLSAQGDGLEIVLEGPHPVTVLIRDIDDASGHWRLTATPKGNAGNPSDPSDPSPHWERGETFCCTRWGSTGEGEVEVLVTATDTATGGFTHKPIFIKVLPEGAKPWP